MNMRALAAAVAAGVALSGCAATNQQWHANCEVSAKDIITEIHGGTSTRTKRVSTSCGPFDVEDAWEVGQFDSWDLWQALQVGKTYDIKTGGKRAGAWNMFPTVIEVKGPKQVVK